MQLEIFDYVQRQLETFFPLAGNDNYEKGLFDTFKKEVLKKYEDCVSSNSIFKNDTVPDPFHIMKYPIFLYLLSRIIFESGHTDEFRLKDRIHSLNKMLHGCSIYYTTKLPTVFFLNYATGIVFAPAEYGNFFVSYHGVSITENHGILPILGSNVVLMPDVLVSGKSILGNHVTVSAGTKIIDKEVPGHSLVFQGPGNELIIKPAKRIYSNKYFSN